MVDLLIVLSELPNLLLGPALKSSCINSLQAQSECSITYINVLIEH